MLLLEGKKTDKIEQNIIHVRLNAIRNSHNTTPKKTTPALSECGGDMSPGLKLDYNLFSKKINLDSN